MLCIFDTLLRVQEGIQLRARCGRGDTGCSSESSLCFWQRPHYSACASSDDPTIKTCTDLACEADLRVCTEGTDTVSAVCGDCVAGYTDDGDACVDIDECALSPPRCGEDFEVCVNSPGAYACECEVGFSDRGTGCERRMQRVVVGSFTTCTVGYGALFCWGSNMYGLVAGSPFERILPPTEVGAGLDWSLVSVGADGACGIAEGTPYCWGDNSWNGFANGEEPDERWTPTAVEQGIRWTHLNRVDG